MHLQGMLLIIFLKYYFYLYFVLTKYFDFRVEWCNGFVHPIKDLFTYI